MVMKLRELKEAITAVFSPRFTTKFPYVPCEVPQRYRGKPEFNDQTCIGCGACVNVCPTKALTMVDDTQASPPVRRITLRYDTCIFCGNCADNCTTDDSIKLSRKWDLATLNKSETVETHEYELQMCEKCGSLIGTKKHLVWLYAKLGPLAYTNPSLLIAKHGQLVGTAGAEVARKKQTAVVEISDSMRILCPKCKCEMNIRL